MPLLPQGARRPIRGRAWLSFGLAVLPLLVATSIAAQSQVPTVLDPAIAQAVAAATDRLAAGYPHLHQPQHRHLPRHLVAAHAGGARGRCLRILDEEADQPARQVTSRPLAGGYVISIGGRDLLALIPADLDPAGTETLEQLAGATVTRLEQALGEAVELRTPQRLVLAGGLTLLATLVLIVLLWLLVRGHTAATRALTSVADRKLERMPGGELMRATRLPEVVRYAMGVLMTGIGLFLVYAWLTFSLRRFPYTRPWGEALRGFLLERLTIFGRNVVKALPDLFTVVLIALLTRMVIRALALVFNAIEEGRATLPGVHPETAASTRRLVSGLMWLFALALAYPYLPGSDTDAFKGVSVFVGLIDLARVERHRHPDDERAHAHLLAGAAARRLRPDRRCRGHGHATWAASRRRSRRRAAKRSPSPTPWWSQPDHQLLAAGRQRGRLHPTSVTIGYDAPWRQVQALLLMAAGRTDGVRASRRRSCGRAALAGFLRRVHAADLRSSDPSQRVPMLDRLHAQHPGRLQRARRADHVAELRGRSRGHEARPARPVVRRAGPAPAHSPGQPPQR